MQRTGYTKMPLERLDWRSLNLFLAVYEEQSVSTAAKALHVSQSNVSYVLDNLRGIFKDELFIRTKHGVSPTSLATALKPQINDIVSQLSVLVQPTEFNPETADCQFHVGMPNFVSNLLIYTFQQRVMQQVESFQLIVNDLLCDVAHKLNIESLDLCLSCLDVSSLNTSDIMQRALAESEWVCFYDADVREAPDSLASIQAGRFIGINVFGENPPRDAVDCECAYPVKRTFDLFVQDAYAVPSLVMGTERLVVAPRLLKSASFPTLAYTSLPYELPPVVIYMLWHKRHQANPEHKWLREQLHKTATELLLIE